MCVPTQVCVCMHDNALSLTEASYDRWGANHLAYSWYTGRSVVRVEVSCCIPNSAFFVKMDGNESPVSVKLLN